MGAGCTWGRGIEWDAVRARMAHQAKAAMGREQAVALAPLAELPAIHSAIEAPRQARNGGPPPLTILLDPRIASATVAALRVS
jgi:hypothetical protein